MTPESLISLTSIVICCLGPLGFLACRSAGQAGTGRACQLSFFVILLLVGLGTMASFLLDAHGWLLGGVTLAGMVVGGTLDSGR